MLHIAFALLRPRPNEEGNWGCPPRFIFVNKLSGAARERCAAASHQNHGDSPLEILPSKLLAALCYLLSTPTPCTAPVSREPLDRYPRGARASCAPGVIHSPGATPPPTPAPDALGASAPPRRFRERKPPRGDRRGGRRGVRARRRADPVGPGQRPAGAGGSVAEGVSPVIQRAVEGSTSMAPMASTSARRPSG